jgi:hypothetical protein
MDSSRRLAKRERQRAEERCQVVVKSLLARELGAAYLATGAVRVSWHASNVPSLISA